MNIPIPYAVYTDPSDDYRVIYCNHDRVTIDTARADRPQLDLTVELLIWKHRALAAERALTAKGTR